MSAITIENDLVHYEVLGRGRPVIFVHGWLGSWRYWVPAMQQLSLKYRTYALDLWGFGDSSKENPGRYSFNEQVRLLNNFMEELGIGKTVLVGHSLGAAICLHFTRLYPAKAHRLMLISAPLYDVGGLDGTPEPEEDLGATQPMYTSYSETIPRNPLKGLGDSPEEILSNLRARNSATAGGLPNTQPMTTGSAGITPDRPILPTGIATPIQPPTH